MTCNCLPYAPCTVVQLDDFNRTVASGWGTASSGLSWSVSAGGGSSSVGSGLGVLVTGSGGLSSVSSGTLPFWPVTPGDEVTFTTLVRYVDTQSPTGSHFRFSVDGVYTIECNEAPDTILIKTNGGGTYTYSTSISLSTFFYIKINVSTVAFNVKAWQVGSPEPSSWMAGDPSVLFEGFSIKYELREGTSSPHLRLEVDSTEFCVGLTTPMPNQPVQDEFVAAWDGTTTIYTTAWPYQPVSLEIEVAGEGVEVDPSNWHNGTFTLVDTSAMTVGDAIYATYLYPCWPISTCVTDTFTRTVAGGWGTADFGLAWQGTTGLSVNGTQGIITVNAANTTRSAALTPPPFGMPFDFSFDVEFSNLAVQTVSPYYLFRVVIGGDNTNLRLDLEPTFSGGYVAVNNGTGTTPNFDAFVSLSGPLSVRVLKEVIAGDTWLHAKVWTAGGAEPSSWTVEDYAFLAVDTQTDFVFQLTQRPSPTNTGFTATIDNVTICP